MNDKKIIDLSIVIVSWNVQDLLKNCIASIYKNQRKINFEIVVIDNASEDQTVEMVKDNFPKVKITANKNNLGFATANNQGILQSHGRYILLLNPDTVIVENVLANMVEFMNKNDRIGVAGCRHVNPNWTLQPSVRRFPTIIPLLIIFTKIARINPRLKSLNHYLARDFNYKITQPVDQVAGSFFLIRKEIIEEVGLLDEKFFIWFEEVDFCKRVNDAGWQVWYNAESKIVHYGGQSFRHRATIKKQILFYKSAYYYFKKHGFVW